MRSVLPCPDLTLRLLPDPPGKMIDYVKCLDCGTEKDREDTYLDIPLPIRLFGATTAFGSVVSSTAQSATLSSCTLFVNRLP